MEAIMSEIYKWLCEGECNHTEYATAKEFDSWPKNENGCRLATHCPVHGIKASKPAGDVVRQPVDYNYNQLDWEFINAMARIGKYGADKYGEGSWKKKVKDLISDKSPTNHIAEHLKAYMTGEGHDHFGDNKMNLAAIAYNAMMEFRKAIEQEKAA